jgi:hypothetical protein
VRCHVSRWRGGGQTPSLARGVLFRRGVQVTLVSLLDYQGRPFTTQTILVQGNDGDYGNVWSTAASEHPARFVGKEAEESSFQLYVGSRLAENSMSDVWRTFLNSCKAGSPVATLHAVWRLEPSQPTGLCTVNSVPATLRAVGAIDRPVTLMVANTFTSERNLLQQASVVSNIRALGFST